MFETPLSSLGWGDFFEGARRQAARPDLVAVRVVADHGARYWLAGPEGRWPARHRFEPGSPCVGDWVLTRPPAGDEPAHVELVLARKTTLERQAAGRQTRRQLIAANVDVVFVVTSPADLNVRRLERYEAAVAASGAQAIFVWNKADRAPPTPGRFHFLLTCALEHRGVDALHHQLEGGRTGVLVGSSGVGKSSLLNAMLGEYRVKVVRTLADGRGQHTTTHRELHVLPGGGLMVDTPGMRELTLWDSEGLQTSFADLEGFAQQCRFRNCQHHGEPGCGIAEAVEQGHVDAGRVAQWKSLRRASEQTADRKRDQQRRQRAERRKKRRRDAAQYE